MPTDTATTTPLSPPEPSVASNADAEPDWSDEPTLAINVRNLKPPPRPSIARTAWHAEDDPTELIEADEIPVSSSGAPSLNTLTLEAGGAHVPHGKPPPDEFLVNLSAANDGVLSTGHDGTLGAPTIDVTSFAAELEPPSVDPALDSERAAEQEREYHPAHTIPLFDMSAVLPAPTETSGGSSEAAPEAKTDTAVRSSEQPARARKFVIPPESAETESETEAVIPLRSSAPRWIGLLAAAAAAAALVGTHGIRWSQPLSTEASPALPAHPVVNNQAALPAESLTEEVANAAPTTSTVAPPTAIVPVEPAPQKVASVNALGAPPSVAAAVKSSANAPSHPAEQPNTVAQSAAEKSDLGVSAADAPLPAAPDTEFDPDAARNALASAASQASACRKEGDPSGTANLTVTFAPSGRVTSAQVEGPPFAGTATGGCIASTMRHATVPAFSGKYMTVSKTIVVQ